MEIAAMELVLMGFDAFAPFLLHVLPQISKCNSLQFNQKEYERHDDLCYLFIESLVLRVKLT